LRVSKEAAAAETFYCTRCYLAYERTQQDMDHDMTREETSQAALLLALAGSTDSPEAACLQQELSSYKVDITTLKQELKVSRCQLTNTKKKLQQQRTEATILQQTVEKRTKQVQKARQVSTTTGQQLKSANQVNRDLRESLAVTIQTSQEHKVALKEKDKMISKLNFQHAELLDQIDVSQKASLSTDERKKRLMDHIYKLESRVQEALAQKRQADETLAKLESQLRGLRKQVPPKPRARKSTNPSTRRWHWAKDFHEKKAKPSNWGPIEIAHFAVGLCKMKCYNVPLETLITLYQGQESRTGSSINCSTYTCHVCTITLPLCFMYAVADDADHGSATGDVDMDTGIAPSEVCKRERV
jgi:hypothetical protein